MSLLSADALMANDLLRRRLDASIRKEAATRRAWEGPAGELARQAYLQPGTVAPSFILIIATNGDVVEAACESCGHVGGVPDDTIDWIVGDSWEGIAAELYPAPEEIPDVD